MVGIFKFYSPRKENSDNNGCENEEKDKNVERLLIKDVCEGGQVFSYMLNDLILMGIFWQHFWWAFTSSQPVNRKTLMQKKILSANYMSYLDPEKSKKNFLDLSKVHFTSTSKLKTKQVFYPFTVDFWG